MSDPQPASNQPSSEQRASTGSSTRSQLSALLDWIKPYKELVLVVTVLGGAIVMLKDYYATRESVDILRCQALAAQAMIESRLSAEELRDRSFNVKVQMADARSDLRAAGRDPEGDPGIIRMGDDIKSLDEQVSAARKLQRDAQKKFSEGCEQGGMQAGTEP